MDADVEFQTGINRPPEDRIAALQAALAAQKTPAVAAPAVAPPPPPPKPTVDPNEPQRKSVAKNVAQIKGTAEDNLMAGLAAYLKPFGTPADILGAQTAAESKRNIDAAKEELKMTSEEEKATARIKAERIKAKAKKDNPNYKASDLKSYYDAALDTQLAGVQVSESGRIILEGSVLFEKTPEDKKDSIRTELANVLAVAAQYRDQGAKLGIVQRWMVQQIDKIKSQR
jgi:hypothetical protein